MTMEKVLPLIFLLAVLPLGTLRAAGPYTVNTTTDTHSVGFSSQSSPGSTAPTDSTGHYSLRSALEYASTVGGSTTITLPTGTYNLTLGDLVAGTAANTTIYINGGGAANTTIHQTVSGDMIFLVDYNLSANVVFNLSNVTITGGSESANDPDGFGGNGGAILAGGSSSAPGNVLSLTNVTFTGNSCNPGSGSGADGGAIQMSGGGNLNVNNCTFIGNNAAKNGGTGYGGAINFDNGGDPGNVVISGSYFSNNIAPGAQGGALNLAGGASGNFTVTGCTFVNNSCVSSATEGGAICVQTGNLTGSYNRFHGNYAASGGAVYISNNTGTTGNLVNNWWGGDSGPNLAGADATFPTTGSSGSLGAGQIAFSPWLELKTSINVNPVAVNGSATITASFLTNSSGQSVSAANITPLVGLPVTWTSANGSLQTPQSTIQSSGTATATFVASTVGSGHVEAQVDGIASGDANATVTFTINNPAPVFSSATNATFLVGSSGSFQVQASGSPTLSENGALPGGVTFNAATGILSGTPAAGSGGIHAVTFTAANSGGTNTQNFTLTVDQRPAVTPPANVVASATNGVCLLPSISFAASASGYPAPVVSYQLNSGTIASPTAFPLGTNVVTCTATNSVGTNSGNFTVTVLPGAAPQLNVIKSSGTMFVSWPTNFTCYSLQTASALASNQWHNFGGIIGTNGGNFIVTNGIPGTNIFFRLAH